MLDTVELEDEEYSYPLVSAVIPNGLNDFKPAPIINRSVVEELDEVPDATAFGELGIEEEYCHTCSCAAGATNAADPGHGCQRRLGRVLAAADRAGRGLAGYTEPSGNRSVHQWRNAA